jgi:hypothetical protein
MGGVSDEGDEGDVSDGCAKLSGSDLHHLHHLRPLHHCLQNVTHFTLEKYARLTTYPT